EDETNQLLLPREAEFRGLLDRGDGVVAGIRNADDLGAGSLRLQQEGRIVRGAERMAYRAEHFADGRLDAFGGMLFQIMTEGVVGGEEHPRLAAFRDHGYGETAAVRVGVVGPVHRAGRALLAGQ